MMTGSVACITEMYRTPFPKRKILDSSKLNEFAAENFEFYINSRKFSKRVENNVGKEKIARNE